VKYIFPLTYLPCVASSALLLALAGCNIYSPIDKPSGDPQLLSAARACLDRADYACAVENYQKLSASQADVAASEQAFTILAQNGAGFGTFASTLGSGATGASFTKLAEALTSGAGQAKRVAIYSAYQKVTGITDPTLKALTRFLTGAALASEIMAEASNGGILRKTDLARGAGCTAGASGTACAVNPACSAPTQDNIPANTGTAASGDITQTAPSGTTPNLDQLYTSIKEALTGLNGLGASGTFASTSTLFTGITGNPAPGTIGAACFRASLLDQGIGE
jgi:hypothetical protein